MGNENAFNVNPNEQPLATKGYKNYLFNLSMRGVCRHTQTCYITKSKINSMR